MSRIRMMSMLAVLAIAFIPTQVLAWPDPIVELDPTVHDFGDVEVGQVADTMITVTNVGGHPLTVSALFMLDGSDVAYTFVNPPVTPFYVPAPDPLDPTANSLNITVRFAPTALGYVTGTVVFACNDPINCPAVVSLGGSGIPVPPEQVTIGDIIAFFDAAVAAGTLNGIGPVNAARRAHRLVFRALLVAAGTLFEAGYDDWGCLVLGRSYIRSDALPRPPDFVQGLALAELNGMIFDVLGYLNCSID